MFKMESKLLTLSLLKYNGKYIEQELEHFMSKYTECWVIIYKLISWILFPLSGI